MTIVLGILILISAVFLVVAVLMQSGSSKKLSGSISGGAETFFGKNKGKTIDKMLGKLTNIVAIVFALLVLACFLLVNRTPKSESTTTTTTTTAKPTTVATTTGTAADKTTSASGSATSATTAASATGAATTASAADTTQGTTASTQAE